MVKIGNIEINSKVVLAPMAGISNSAFRRICKSMGADLVYAEMVSDKAIYYNNKKTIDMLYTTDEERPIAQQIFGSDITSFVVAAKFIEETMHPDIIDINMGCPVPKVALKAQAVSIPVIGNGDVKTCFDAKRMLDETNCDFVMIGRGLLGNPWLIKEINEYLENGVVIDKPTDIEKIDMCLKHLSLLEEFECEKQAVLEIRSHVGWYLKGIRNANLVKQNIFKTKNINEIKRMLNELKDSLKEC